MPPDNSPLRLLCLEYCDFVNSAVLDPCDLAVTRHTCHDCDLGGDVCLGASFLGAPIQGGPRDPAPLFTLYFCVVALKRKGSCLGRTCGSHLCDSCDITPHLLQA